VRWAVIIGALFVIAASPKSEYDFTGARLLELCEPDPRGVCVAYIAGAHAGAQAAELDGWKPRYGRSTRCVPDGVTRRQKAVAVTKWLTEHPGELHHPAPLLVMRASFETYPCTEHGEGSAAGECPERYPAGFPCLPAGSVLELSPEIRDGYWMTVLRYAVPATELAERLMKEAMAAGWTVSGTEVHPEQWYDVLRATYERPGEEVMTSIYQLGPMTTLQVFERLE
jgi:hypothetical protein